jgi:hypothetical protein
MDDDDFMRQMEIENERMLAESAAERLAEKKRLAPTYEEEQALREEARIAKDAHRLKRRNQRFFIHVEAFFLSAVTMPVPLLVVGMLGQEMMWLYLILVPANWFLWDRLWVRLRVKRLRAKAAKAERLSRHMQVMRERSY